MLDGQIGNAPPAVEHSLLDEGVGRARVQASAAGPTPIGFERWVNGEIKIGQHTGEERERPAPGIDQHRVLADPPQASALGQLSLGNRSRIDMPVGDGAGVAEGADRTGELLERLS